MSKIGNSVGKHGVNKDADTRIVQALLNRHIVPPSRIIKVDGLVGPNTITAILAFQQRLGFAKPDGLVSPAGRTFSALCTLPYSVLLTEKVLDHFSNFSNILGKMGRSLGSNIESFAKTFSNENSKTVNSSPLLHLPPSSPDAIAWGAKVTPEFKKRVIEICKELVIAPDYLMACMAFETGETFKADELNRAGSGAVGLIQFMPKTAEWLNTSTNALAKMTTVGQLEYVRKYFLSYRGRLKTLEDVYMVILWPKAIGKDPDTAIFKAGTKVYNQNKGFDKYPNNGEITPRECAAAVYAAYKKGISKGYFG